MYLPASDSRVFGHTAANWYSPRDWQLKAACETCLLQGSSVDFCFASKTIRYECKLSCLLRGITAGCLAGCMAGWWLSKLVQDDLFSDSNSWSDNCCGSLEAFGRHCLLMNYFTYQLRNGWGLLLSCPGFYLLIRFFVAIDAQLKLIMRMGKKRRRSEEAARGDGEDWGLKDQFNDKIKGRETESWR